MKEEIRNGVRLIRYRTLSAYDNFFEADGIAVTTDNLHRSSLDETVHQHDYYELEYIAAGGGIQWINGCTYVVKKAMSSFSVCRIPINMIPCGAWMLSTAVSDPMSSEISDPWSRIRLAVR